LSLISIEVPVEPVIRVFVRAEEFESFRGVSFFLDIAGVEDRFIFFAGVDDDRIPPVSTSSELTELDLLFREDAFFGVGLLKIIFGVDVKEAFAEPGCRVGEYGSIS